MAQGIKDRLSAGEMVRVMAVGALANPKLIEIAAMHGGYHAIWIDEEHAALSQNQIELMALACRASGLDAYVRLAPVSYAAVMRPMEAGVGGIMAAQIRSVEEAQQVVKWAKYPPVGERGLNISNYEGAWTTCDPASFIESTNRDRWLSVQIETLGAVDQLEEIAAIDGIDHLFVGPADLSVSLGVPGDYMNEKCIKVLERVSAAVKQVGKSWGILARGPEHATLCQQLGCQLFAFASDLSLVNLGFKQTRKLYEDFFE